MNPNRIINIIQEVIRKTPDKKEWCVYSKKSNKNLGCSSSEGDAKKRLGQVEYFKSLEEDEQPLEEMSSMSSGAVEGAMTKSPFVNFDDKENERQKKLEEYDTKSISHEPYQELMRKLHPHWKNNLIGKGGQKATVAGSPYKNKPSMKRAKSAPPLGENYMIDRNKLIEEMQLRKVVQNLIVEEKKQYLLEQKEKYEDEQLLREYVRKIIKEAVDQEEIPHSSTGINVLEQLLKKIIPILEIDYKSLTTEKSQRDSFRAHILNAVQNTLISSRITDQAGKEKEEIKTVEEGEIDIKVGDSIGAEDEKDSGIENNIDDKGFIDIKKSKKQKISNFIDIPGKDLTGRNQAFKTFEKIEKNIVDSYDILDNDEDINLFFDYLMVNLKMYMDKYEEEIQSSVSEPDFEIYDEKSTEESVSS